MRHALHDLEARAGTRATVPPGVRAGRDGARISPDSAARMVERTRRDMTRYPSRTQVVSLSDVGFSRDGSVAVVYVVETCGWNCGAGTLQVFRRYPDGWLAAEVLFEVVS